MAFRRFSLRGFSSEYTIRRQVEPSNGKYLVGAALYRGRHLRVKVDEISTGISQGEGLSAAEALAGEFRDKLVERYGLQHDGAISFGEALDRA